MSFAIIPSHSVACIFIFLTLFFAKKKKKKKFFFLMRFSLSISSFMVLYLKSHRYTQSHIMLSLRNFVVLHFAFRCVICFKMIFLKGVRCESRFTFSHENVQLFQHYLLKNYFCSIVLFPLLCQQSIDCIYVVLSVDSHESICLFFHHYHTIFSIIVAL